MLAAFVVVPTFVLVYVLGSPASRRRRLLDLTLGFVVLVMVSAAWLAAYDLTPPDRRPYAGTTDRNAMAELVIGPYGVGRFVRQPRLLTIPSLEAEPGDSRPAPTARPAEPSSRSPAARLFVRAPAGPLRLADGQLAGQALWLWPLALAGLALGARGARWRPPLAPETFALLLWVGWALTYAAVYSAAAASSTSTTWR